QIVCDAHRQRRHRRMQPAAALVHHRSSRPGCRRRRKTGSALVAPRGLLRAARESRLQWRSFPRLHSNFSAATMPADVLALFYLDHTLMPHDSDEQWVAFLVEQGALDAARYDPANRDL